MKKEQPILIDLYARLETVKAFYLINTGLAMADAYCWKCELKTKVEVDKEIKSVKCMVCGFTATYDEQQVLVNKIAEIRQQIRRAQVEAYIEWQESYKE